MKNRHSTASAQRFVVLVIFLASVSFVGTVSYAFMNMGKGASTKTTPATLAVSDETNPVLQAEVDSDSDGLADWEEVLWGTDPKNPDTDGNGVRDNEEVLQKSEEGKVRSELLALETLGSTEGGRGNTTDKELTLTDVASRDLFASYMSKLRTGDQPNVVEQDAIAGHAIESIKPLIEPPTYNASEVQTIVASSEHALSYLETMHRIIVDLSTGTPDGSGLLLRLAQGESRDKVLEDLRNTIAYHKKCIDEMKAVPVPSDALEVHVGLIKSLLLYTYALEGFLYIDTDPMRSAVSLQTLQPSRVGVQVAATTYEKYAQKYGFTPTTTQ